LAIVHCPISFLAYCNGVSRNCHDYYRCHTPGKRLIMAFLACVLGIIACVHPVFSWRHSTVFDARAISISDWVRRGETDLTRIVHRIGEEPPFLLNMHWSCSRCIRMPQVASFCCAECIGIRRSYFALRWFVYRYRDAVAVDTSYIIQSCDHQVEFVGRRGFSVRHSIRISWIVDIRLCIYHSAIGRGQSPIILPLDSKTALRIGGTSN